MTQTSDITSIVEAINNVTSDVAYYSESHQLTAAHIARHRATELYAKLGRAYEKAQAQQQATAPASDRPRTAEELREVIAECDRQLERLQSREDEVYRVKARARFDLAQLTGMKAMCWYCSQFEDSDQGEAHKAACYYARETFPANETQG